MADATTSSSEDDRRGATVPPRLSGRAPRPQRAASSYDLPAAGARHAGPSMSPMSGAIGPLDTDSLDALRTGPVPVHTGGIPAHPTPAHPTPAQGAPRSRREAREAERRQALEAERRQAREAERRQARESERRVREPGPGWVRVPGYRELREALLRPRAPISPRRTIVAAAVAGLLGTGAALLLHDAAEAVFDGSLGGPPAAAVPATPPA